MPVHHQPPCPPFNSRLGSITTLTRRSFDFIWQDPYNQLGRFVDQAALARLGRVYPQISPEPLLQIGEERFVVIDQVGCVDQFDRGVEPADVDQAAPQAVVPDHDYQLGPQKARPRQGWNTNSDSREPATDWPEFNLKSLACLILFP